MGPVWREGSIGGVHRIALDHNSENPDKLSNLTFVNRNSLEIKLFQRREPLNGTRRNGHNPHLCCPTERWRPHCFLAESHRSGEE